MFLMDDPEEERKQREQERILMEQIIKEEQQQQKGEQQDGDKEEKVGTKNKKAPKKEKKEKKEQFTTKITKKNEVMKAIKGFIPEGVKLYSDKRPSQDEYKQMQQALEVEQFSLNFKTFLGKILRVTDGDTLKVAFKLTDKLTRFSFRINGVDTPESRGGQVKEYGMYVKEVLRRMLEGKIVRLQAGQFDKYGRVLARIYAYSDNQEFCVNDFLIQNELAKPYQGKTKDQFTKKDYEQFKKKFVRTSWPEVVHYPRLFFKDNSSKQQ